MIALIVCDAWLQLLLDWIDANIVDDMSQLQLVWAASGKPISTQSLIDGNSTTLTDAGIDTRCLLALRTAPAISSS